MKQQRLANLGILIMALAFISKAVFFLVLNPEYLDNFYYRSSTNLYVKDTPGDFWIRYVYYSTVGLLGVLFAYQFYRQFAKNKLLKAATIMLLISSLLWISFGYVSVFDETDTVSDFHLLRMILW